MTYNEAKYVLANRQMYSDADYRYALEIVESTERQNPHLLED